jgi:hypothetical protein
VESLPRRVLSRFEDLLAAATAALFAPRRKALQASVTPAVVPPSKPIEPKRNGKLKRTWVYLGLQADAHTKSEARAEFKRLTRLKRLPIGARVWQVR